MAHPTFSSPIMVALTSANYCFASYTASIPSVGIPKDSAIRQMSVTDETSYNEAKFNISPYMGADYNDPSWIVDKIKWVLWQLALKPVTGPGFGGPSGGAGSGDGSGSGDGIRGTPYLSLDITRYSITHSECLESHA